jgi:hypothetical protein
MTFADYQAMALPIRLEQAAKGNVYTTLIILDRGTATFYQRVAFRLEFFQLL